MGNMTEAEDIMGDFMEKFCLDGFELESIPNEDWQIDDAFIGRQLTYYSKLLKSE